MKPFVDRQRVVLGIANVLLKLSPLTAANLAEELELTAAIAKQEPECDPIGEVWNASVTNRDRQVILKFDPIRVRRRDRVVLSWKAAEVLADLLKTNADFAGHGLRISLKGV